MQANDARCTPHDPRRWKTSCPFTRVTEKVHAELAEVAGAVSAAALVIGAEEVMFSSVMLAASTAQVHGPPYIPAVRAIAMQDGKANCGKWFECPARFSCNVTSTDMHFPQNFTLREEWSASSGGSAGAYAGLELQMCTYTQFPGMCSNPSDPPKKLSFWVQLLGTFYSWKKPITVAALGISLEDRIPDSQQIVGVSSQCIDYCYQPNPVGGGSSSNPKCHTFPKVAPVFSHEVAFKDNKTKVKVEIGYDSIKGKIETLEAIRVFLKSQTYADNSEGVEQAVTIGGFELTN